MIRIKESICELKKFPVIPLYDRVYLSLRHDIFKGVYEPGTRLVEEEISQKADVSRTPVREALKRLAAEGLVEFQPKRGAVVVGNNVNEIAFLWDTRIYLEMQSVKLAMMNMTEARKERLQIEIKKMRSITPEMPRNEIALIITGFNNVILEMADLRQLRRVYNLINLFISDTFEIMMEDHEKLQSACVDHISIAGKMINGDIEAAIHLTQQHLLKWKDIYINKYFHKE